MLAKPELYEGCRKDFAKHLVLYLDQRVIANRNDDGLLSWKLDGGWRGDSTVSKTDRHDHPGLEALVIEWRPKLLFQGREYPKLKLKPSWNLKTAQPWIVVESRLLFQDEVCSASFAQETSATGSGREPGFCSVATAEFQLWLYFLGAGTASSVN